MKHYLLFLAAFAMASCSGEAKPVTGDDDDTVGDDDDDDDDDDNTGTPPAADYFEPVAVGFEFEGGVMPDGTITGYRFPGDPATTGYEYLPIVILTFASEAYFSATDEETQANESCYAFAILDAGILPAASPIPTSPFSGGDPPFLSYDLALPLDPGNTTCFGEYEGGKLDPAAWGSGGTLDLMDAFNGAHFGMAFGPLTPYILEGFGTETTTDTEFMDAVFTEYIAINDSAGVWSAGDWTLGYLFEWNEVTHEALVDPTDDTLTYKPAGPPWPGGYVRSNAFWYQDFPLLDLTNLKDGA